MFDGFKIQIVDMNFKLDKALFDFNIHYDRFGNLVSKTFKRNGIRLIHASQTNNCYLQGSFHKFKNNGKHNYDKFTLSDFINTIDLIQTLFGFDISDSKIKRLEFGININVAYEIQDLIDGIVFHEGKIPLQDYQLSKRFNHTKYDLKIYSKSLQFRNQISDQNILRFERKFNYSTELKKEGIKTIADLKNQKNIEYFNASLLKDWENIVFVDPTVDVKLLSSYERNQLNVFRNSNYWSNLKPTNRYRPKLKLQYFNQLCSSDIKSKIRALIQANLIFNMNN